MAAVGHLWVTELAALDDSAVRMALQFDLFRDRQGVVDFDAEVAHGALQLGMTEQQLNPRTSPVSCRSVKPSCVSLNAFRIALGRAQCSIPTSRRSARTALSTYAT